MTSAPDVRRPIKTAPRNGRSVVVGGEGVGEYLVHWNGSRQCSISGQLGVWEGWDQTFTWTEHQGCGPTYWVQTPDQMAL